MSIKQISKIVLLSFLFIGCSRTNKSDYNNQTILGVSFNNTEQRGLGENPIVRPSYEEYRESIDNKKLDTDSILP